MRLPPLVDELHLFVYPVALGAGRRLWGESNDSTRLALKAHEAYDNGVVHLTYAPG
jgi:dihydrofolate reductase